MLKFLNGLTKMANGNGKFGKWALGLGTLFAAGWVGWVSSGVIRAEVREARLCAVEKIIEKMDQSVRDLANLNERLNRLVKQLEEEHDTP